MATSVDAVPYQLFVDLRVIADANRWVVEKQKHSYRIFVIFLLTINVQLCICIVLLPGTAQGALLHAISFDYH